MLLLCMPELRPEVWPPLVDRDGRSSGSGLAMVMTLYVCSSKQCHRHDAAFSNHHHYQASSSGSSSSSGCSGVGPDILHPRQVAM